jgi:hypothetical protein
VLLSGLSSRSRSTSGPSVAPASEVESDGLAEAQSSNAEVAESLSSDTSEPAPDPLDAFLTAIHGGDLPGALAAVDGMSAEDLDEIQRNDTVSADIPRHFDLLDSVTLLNSVWCDPAFTADVIFANGGAMLLEAATTCDPVLARLLDATPDGIDRLLALLPDNQSRADVLNAYVTDVQRQLTIIGLLGGTPDWDLLVRVLTLFEQADRQTALLEVRAQDRWDEMLSALDESHVPIVQGWLNQDLGDNTDQSLQERIDAAMNSSRAAAALAAIDGMAAQDTEERISPRLRELMALGVAMPRLAGSDIATEGYLTQNSATRAARSFIYMPAKEYIRATMLLELTGDEARLQQSFVMIEAVAARAGEFGPVQQALDDTPLADIAGSGNLEDLESFSDDTRSMDEAELADATSVTQTSGGGRVGMTQKFTDSCGPTSAQVVRAEADPIEALRLNQNGELGQDALDTDSAREQEASLERNNGQTAVPRGRAAVITAVTTALGTSTCSASERMAILNYLNGVAFDQAAYDSGVPKLETSMGASWPGEDAFRMVREGAAGTGGSAGLTPGQLVTEGNDQLDVDDITGRPMQDLFDLTLWNLFTAAGRQVNAVNMGAWSGRVTALLNQAEPLIEQGHDVIFIVYWNGSGGHFMTFTNVKTETGVRSFLVHDPWTGRTQWVTEANILAGNWPGGSGLICGLQG